MTRRHYQAIAAALFITMPTPGDNDAFTQWLRTANAIADVCESENPRFDRERFIAACSNGAV